MARITVEDCLTKETNRFALVLLAAKRAKQILHGSPILISEKRDNKEIVTSLREIAAGAVRFMTEDEEKEAALSAEREKEEVQVVKGGAETLVNPVAEEPILAVDGEGSEEIPARRNGDSSF